MSVMLIVAGCNGSGKTTLTHRLRRDPLTPFSQYVWLNPDQTTQDLIERYPDLTIDAANLAAAQVNEIRVDNMIDRKMQFMVETTLASDKYLERVRRAKANGFYVYMFYSLLATANLAVARVAARVATGGHNVDPGKIRKRWRVSQENLLRFIPLVDELTVYDNSSSNPGVEPAVVFEKRGNRLIVHRPDLLPEPLQNQPILTPR